MRLRGLALAGVAAVSLMGSQAMAGTVFSNNFDAEAPSGQPDETVTSLTGMTVTNSVKLLSGAICAGGAGQCIALTTPEPGSKVGIDQGISFKSGQEVTLAFDARGDGFAESELDFHFSFDAPTNISHIISSGALLDTSPDPVNGNGAVQPFLFDQGFTQVTLSFLAGADGVAHFTIGGGPDDNEVDGVGPIIDNLTVAVDPAILPVGGAPEPDAWALLIVGFGGVGALARRRRIAAA